MNVFMATKQPLLYTNEITSKLMVSLVSNLFYRGFNYYFHLLRISRGDYA
jgi:hypothetical protein